MERVIHKKNNISCMPTEEKEPRSVIAFRVLRNFFANETEKKMPRCTHCQVKDK